MKNIGLKIIATIIGFVGMSASCVVMSKSLPLGFFLLALNVYASCSLFCSILRLDKYS